MRQPGGYYCNRRFLPQIWRPEPNGDDLHFTWNKHKIWYENRTLSKSHFFCRTIYFMYWLLADYKWLLADNMIYEYFYLEIAFKIVFIQGWIRTVQFSMLIHMLLPETIPPVGAAKWLNICLCASLRLSTARILCLNRSSYNSFSKTNEQK